MAGSRRTQPYRRGSLRRPSAALANMTRGRTLYGENPQDARRAMQRKARRRRTSSSLYARIKARARA